jgi:exodeoxyribonuclease VII large subunit
LNSPFHDQEPPQVLTVSQLNRQAKTLLESHFDFVWVGGEISSFARPSSGHWYFTLNEGNTQVRCAMFRNRNQRLRFTPEQGDDVRVRCRVSLYEGRGEFQLIVEHMELAGAGALQAAFEKLKNKLQAEGLFDQARKKTLPQEIQRLGVITSPTGAAIHDILHVLERRCPSIEVFLLPVAVQGEGAAQQIAAAIERANRWQRAGSVDLDALVVGRGGGSVEDLWAFNEEAVARAIADSELPVISAVGHEVDFSIADLVADQRAATPSAAAEMLSPDQGEWRALLQGLSSAMARLVRGQLAREATRLEHLQQRLRHPGAQLREQAQRVDDLEQRLLLAQRNLLHRRAGELQLLRGRLQGLSPAPLLQRLQVQNIEHSRRLHSAMEARLRACRQQLGRLAQVLDSLSPLAVLQRGYGIVEDGDGTVLTDATQVKVGDTVIARLARGSLGLVVERVDPAKD